MIADQKRRRDIYMFDGGPGRQYIGQTVDLKARQSVHRNHAKLGVDTALYRAVNKHGWAAFPLRILAYGWWTDEQANAAESGYIAYHNTYLNGLNETRGGDGVTGYKHSEEALKKIHASSAGENNPRFGVSPSQETRDRIAAGNRGKTLSAETKAKMSDAKCGEKNYMFGKSHTVESRAKMREAKLGKKRGPVSDEALSNMKAAQQARRARERAMLVG